VRKSRTCRHWNIGLNPFDPHVPTRDPAAFFGRADLFAFIRQYLVGGRRAQTIALIGGRGMGKTSTLFACGHRIEGRIIAAYVPLADVEPGRIFAAMAESARDSVAAAGIAPDRLPDPPDDASYDWFADAFVPMLLSVLRNRRILFTFDHTGELIKAIEYGAADPDISSQLSTLNALHERLNMIFAVDNDDEQRIETFEPLQDQTLYRRLGMLTVGEAEELTRTLSEPHYTIDDDAVEGIVSMTGGHPALLHSLNSVIWESARAENRTRVALQQVENALTPALAEAYPILRGVWDDSTDTEKAVLTTMTTLTETGRGRPVRVDALRTYFVRESDTPPDETSIAAALRSLEYREVLATTAAGEYIFGYGLQFRWLKSQGIGYAVYRPPQSAPAVRTPSRAVFAFGAVIIAAAALALILGQLAGRAGAPPPTDNGGTLTLAPDLIQTRDAANTTATFLNLPTETSTHTPSFTATWTPTETLTPSQTFTYTPSHTATLTPTNTLTPSQTFTPTNTATETLTPSQTFTHTPSNTPTLTLTATSTSSYTPSVTPSTTPSNTATHTPTITRTPTITPPFFPTGQFRATAGSGG
jgi:hypothetical protein